MNILPRAQQKCGNCDAFVRNKTREPMGICVDRSPTPILVNMHNPAHALDPKQPAVVQVVQGIFPATDELRWCRKWCMKVEGST